MEKQELISIIDRYLAGQATEPEQEMIANYYDSFQQGAAWDEARFGPKSEMVAEVIAKLQEAIQEDPSHNILDAPVHRIHFLRRSWVRYAAAAVFIAVMVFVGKQLITEKPRTEITKIINVPAPASNRASLTLANGKVVYLDSANNGELALQENVKLVKLADGKISYSGTATELQYNTLTNPKGSKAINIELPDHSQIWLNAGSSITYPIAFIGKTRNVTMTGELYYEVSHNQNQPFIVTNGNTSVTVLGTHFNVKAYDNEPNMKVTLLEGSVRVKQDTKTQLLKPNQQAIVETANIDLVEDADSEQAIAWKNGFTSFHSADIQTVLRELERWYDITTEVKGELKIKSFYTEAPRTAPLKDILKSILDDNNIAYEYDSEKRKLTILP